MAVRRILSLFLMVVAVVTAACTQRPSEPPLPESVRISGHTVLVTRAVTPDEQAIGLGGTLYLNWDEGMLFIFDTKEERTFWMKGMVMPIDIIWIAHDRVVGFEKNVQPPETGVTVEELSLYPSGVAVTHVLEVKAGFVDRYGIAVGDAVEYH